MKVCYSPMSSVFYRARPGTRACFALAAVLSNACLEVDSDSELDADASVAEDVLAGGEELKTTCEPLCGLSGQSCGHQDDGCGGTIWCGTCACPSTFRACEVTLPTIYEVPVTLTAGVPFEVWTTNLSAGADSVIHILDANTGSQLTMNDNTAGTLASRVLYTSATTRDAVVVVRAKSPASQGTATFNTWVGSLQIQLGAYEQFVQAPRTGDQLETVRMPADGGLMHVAYEMNGDHVIRRRVGGGIGNTVSFSLSASSSTKRFILGQTPHSLSVGTAAAGKVRLVRNDKNVGIWGISTHDSDGDGLGYELEAALGTCPARSGTATGPDGNVFDCATIADAKDTDGDGLQDGWEVLGRRHAAGNLPLAQWGARARRKDIFVEADFGLETAAEVPQRVPATAVRTMVTAYADRWDPLSSAQRTQHANMVRNPDRSIGFALHVDNGVSPASENEATYYGNWGGYSVVPAAASGPLPAAQAWPQYMNPARVGVFRYWLGSVGGGGGLSDWNSYNAQFSSGSTSAHELGHVFGLAHSGAGQPNGGVDPQCKPNYASLMNYAFMGIAGFSDGANAPVLNNFAVPESFVANPTTMQSFLNVAQSVFGYKIDAALGHVDWNRDGVFAPQGSTVRGYLNSKTAESCEYTRYGSTLIDSFTTTLSPALTRYNGRTLVLYPGTTSIRFAVSPSSLACSAVNTQSCANFTTTASVAVDATGGVDAVHFSDPESTAIVARGADGRLRMVHIVGLSGDTPLFSSSVVISNRVAAGEPAFAKDVNGGGLLVFRDATGALFQAPYTRSGASGSFGTETSVLDQNGNPMSMSSTKASPGIGVSHVPASGTTPVPMMYGAFADSNNLLRLYYRDSDGRFKPRASEVHEITARPQIQWVHDPSDQVLGGRMVVAFTTREWGSPENRNIWVMRSHVPASAPGQIAIGLWQGYDSNWTAAYGIDLMFEPGLDDNLRAAWTLSTNYPNATVRQKVKFDPKADGINDHAYGPSNDWQVMRINICSTIAATNGVSCLPQDW